MRADDTTVLSSSGPGRDSIRIQSNAQYTTHVVVYVTFSFHSLSFTEAKVPSSYTIIVWTSATCPKVAGV